MTINLEDTEVKTLLKALENYEDDTVIEMADVETKCQNRLNSIEKIKKELEEYGK